MSDATSLDEHPAELLRRLEEDRGRYGLLLERSGSLAAAAHHLATARCRVRAVPTHVPSSVEVFVAAMRVWDRTGQSGPRPHRDVVAGECHALGLPVIPPLAA